MQINAVQQRAAQAGLVAADLIRAAATRRHVAPQKSAGTRIHGRNELECGGKLGAVVCAHDGDAAIFQRFAQCFQGAALKLR